MWHSAHKYQFKLQVLFGAFLQVWHSAHKQHEGGLSITDNDSNRSQHQDHYHYGATSPYFGDGCGGEGGLGAHAVGSVSVPSGSSRMSTASSAGMRALRRREKQQIRRRQKLNPEEALNFADGSQPKEPAPSDEGRFLRLLGTAGRDQLVDRFA